MADRSANKPGNRAPRHWGRAQSGVRKDAYISTKKLTEPTACPQCGAVYHRGRWQWSAVPEGAEKTLCEACRRTNDDFPAGILHLEGDAVAAHADEIERLFRHQEKAEKSRHPLNRIMTLERVDPGALIVKTTDIHLPRRLARAVEKAYGGRAVEHYEKDGDFVRIEWRH